jgi:branched-chain amino acid aminotransferase
MSEPLAFLNGKFRPQSGATLALNDAGFVCGATVTDLCRTFQQRLYRWPDHLARFRRSCEAACIPLLLTDDQIGGLAQELVTENAKLIAAEHELILVLVATPGNIGYYLGETGGAGDGSPTLGIHTFPLPFARYRGLIEQGAALVVPSVRHVPEPCVAPNIKQRSRMHWWLAEQEVKRTQPGAQALLLDIHGKVTETAAANFLIVKNGVVISPPLDSILEGISLKVTRELCGRLGIAFQFRALTLNECLVVLPCGSALDRRRPHSLAGPSIQECVGRME